MNQINWESFKTYNQDSRGVHFKFEDLCRQLFINENLSGNKLFRYLHANPNNYGLETEPIYDETNDRWIGFQAKFFDGDVEYSQIRHSADKIIEYYTGKAGRVDLVYLFCNKPITVSAQGYVDTVERLKTSKIDIQLITNEAILDLVRNKYPYLAQYYFGNYMIQSEWFITHANHMFEELGERYNRKFNVETECLNKLSLFVHDQRAADLLNARKKELTETIEELRLRDSRYRSYLFKLYNAVMELSDVSTESFCTSVNWADIVKKCVEPELDAFNEEIERLKAQQEEIYQRARSDDIDKKEKQKAFEEALKIGRRIDDLTKYIELPEKVAITDIEQSILNSQVMMLSGRAGTGKSQLLATKTKELIDDNRIALLLIASIYYTSDPIQEQITKNLRLDLDFEDLIDVLETIGEKNNCIVPMFIDAINETWNNKLWKTGLPLIVDKLKASPLVRLVVSYRPEYEQILIPATIGSEEDIVKIYHNGFADNSLKAIKEFLNYYSIPFTPLEYFGYELANPLFLTLYCKTYNGEEVSLPTLYERLIDSASSKIYSVHEEELRSRGYCDGGVELFRPLIGQIASFLVMHEERSILKSDLIKLSFWSEYGLTSAPYINLLIKENVLHNHVFDNVEKIYFAYDQMNDYYCAKAILDMFRSKEDLRKYLAGKVLGIQDNKLEKTWNVDLFVNACVLYAEKYGEECIDIIDELSDENDQRDVFSRYLTAFQWRNTNGISGEKIIELIKKYPCLPDDLWPMLIGNSVKVTHPLNAYFLHGLLSQYELNRRDYLWTVYINKLTWDDSDRVVQLIKMYDGGEKLEIKDERQIELLLILFGWILTSSNRWLRDYTSKAMVEILKEDINLCKSLLERFNNVNDPYVLQRLYGVVFGACCKREKGDLQPLAEYVYESVFNQERVYPDILLRDYARLIIEEFLAESLNYEGIIIREKIYPPYISDSIPDIEDQHYEDMDSHGAMLQLIMSMRVDDKMGGYGDFGRYVFQSALSNFDVDIRKMFNYAIYHIVNDLGFNEEYFGYHDSHIGGYDRHFTAKTERIGKKYQWITMYEMLARIADNCKMIDRWGYPEKEEMQFEGAWEPYVRDFDPTLNSKCLDCNDAPVFEAMEKHREEGIKDNKEADISTPELQKTWLEQKGRFIEQLKDTLILSDEKGQQWVTLTKYCDTGRRNLDIEKLSVWSWMYAYFITSEQAEEFKDCAEKKLSIITQETATHHETYTVFNREYPWSPSCRSFEECAWVNVQLKTGEVETVTEHIQIPDIIIINDLLRKYGGINDNNDDAKENTAPIQKERTIQRDIEKDIGKILHATTDLIWEEEYDATKEETISISVPCGMLIEKMGLKLLNSNGFYFDSEGRLAAFDTDLTQKINSVVVRKDILDSFLEQTDMKLVWLVDAEKEIHAEDRSIESWSDWEAVYIYDNDLVSGDVHRISNENH